MTARDKNALIAILAIMVASGLAGCSIFGGNGTTKPPSNAATKKVQQAIGNPTNKGIIYSDLSSLHDDANQWVGYGHTPDWGPWSEQAEKTYIPAVEKVKKEVEKDAHNKITKAVLKDLDNAEALLKIAEQKHDRQALLYFHRIMSDLANYVYSKNKGDEYFGATHALNGSEASTIDEYVKSE
ncbi:MAG: hypothetical protein K6T63_13380 [Alicyclobacillus herbarius]|uniref:hypothetical protein n=1 Tax=Alicyclobacillus herbarius TaxID=122960 RepID=UPI0023545A89|nr:hypothetical protein [Alicyclobacillus herbarius]MCL6633610.1 hypothetical protein [Alicyclobacillus herbarius]